MFGIKLTEPLEFLDHLWRDEHRPEILRTTMDHSMTDGMNCIGDRLVNRTHFGAENGPTWETI